jgi:hypothetical protein
MPVNPSEVDRLLVRLRGLVLVRDLLQRQGATPVEIEEHSAEIERVKWRLAGIVRASLQGPGATDATASA